MEYNSSGRKKAENTHKNTRVTPKVFLVQILSLTVIKIRGPGGAQE